jgi:argininosuccinate lyase
LADYLVAKQNMPFRTAYYITKDVVQKANSLNKDISELNISEIRSSSKELKNIDEEIVSYLDLRNSMNVETHLVEHLQNKLKVKLIILKSG